MLYALTIFVSAFLLFLVQPLIAKQILPWFGGTASVWTVCLVFFQFVLLAGYVYADRLSRLPLRRQALVHTALVIAACLMLPVIPDAGWKPTGDADPTLRILALLAATIGLPYLAICTTGPLVQSWFARVQVDAPAQSRVYRLFALSNLASLAALVAYPFALEPYASVRVQSWGWSAGFVLFAALVIASAWLTERRAPRPIGDGAAHAASGEPPRTGDLLLWIGLSALGTVMLLAITTHVTQDVASVPFLWILPLALYLLTFILCFDSAFWYRRWLFWPVVIVMAPLMAWSLNSGPRDVTVVKSLLVYCGGLFAVCMFCHGELVRARPAPAWLTRFYLMISLGGALGGLFVGVVAPRIFNGTWELPIALVAAGLLLWRVARGFAAVRLVLVCALLLAAFGAFVRGWMQVPVGTVVVLLAGLSLLLAAVVAGARRSAGAGATLLAGLCAAGCVWLGWLHVQTMTLNVATMERNFYGTLRVKEYDRPGTPGHAGVLVHGVISHGIQYQSESMKRLATTYYGETSGAGLAITALRAQAGRGPLRIGVVGLGTGTLATYGTPDGTIRYYEINPAVVGIARSDFTYLADSAATIEVAVGDARLLMEREAAAGQLQQFDVLVVDAFSSDSIPVHLMTREAMAVYARHVRPDGIIAFHVSNRYLNLVPVAMQMAHGAGFAAVWVEDNPGPDRYWDFSTSYVLATRDTALLETPAIKAASKPVVPIAGFRPWTDDYNNLFRILR